MDELNELLQKIKLNPKQFLERQSVELLSAFLDGYLYHSQNAEAIKHLNDFSSYLRKKNKLSTSHGWASIIQFFHASEKPAFEWFFKEYEWFNEDKNKPTRK